MEVKIEGTLAEVPKDVEITEEWIRLAEDEISHSVQQLLENTLAKLQKELKTDLIRLGEYIYRRHPHEWHRMEERWDELFAQAQVDITVQTDITHKGMINQSRGSIFKKPQYNPYRLNK
ncbi:putative nuclease with TOPRIM domain [Caldalkalibacillus uzonensis]|uniref:Nuclease with TOPRIM domain n=1 Tax=Caldalkalibacillus uzonensis TaxID=353224 RepID=A0ABU0CWG0_9BACI|nr:putative nuclease with TOPRIM domain [Caldalkalibacillus uzonensis]